MIKNKPFIAVIGSSKKPYPTLTRPLGRWIAEKGFNLINGGGPGVMAEAAKSFSSVKNREGVVVGVIPAGDPCESPELRSQYRPLPGYPNHYTDLVIRTHLHTSGTDGKEISSRNHIVVLSADVIIALPGRDGTRSEIELALEYGKPLIIVSSKGEWEKFADHVPVVQTLDEALERIEEALTKISKRRVKR